MAYSARTKKAWTAHTPKSGSTLAKEAAVLLLCIAGAVLFIVYKDRFLHGTRLIPALETSISAAGAPNIRVAVIKDAQSVKISAGLGEARVITANGQEIRRLQTNSSVQFTAAPRGLVLDGTQLVPGSRLIIENTAAGQPLRVNDQEVAPRIVVYREFDPAPPAPANGTKHPDFSIRPGCLTVVAHINLEEYLVGVLSGEVPVDRWQPEALKSQAIASRSYAYFELKKNAADPYDVESTVMSQVFRLGSHSNPAVNAVLNATRGLVLTANGTLFPAYFHSTCGGHTDRSTNVFPDQPFVPPLAGTACAFCAQSPSYRWKAYLSKDVLEQRLKTAYGPSQPIGRLQLVEFFDQGGVQIGPSGNQLRRATVVRVHHTRGCLVIQGNNFRLMAGPKELKSLAFEQVVDNGAGLEISGGGFGHGIGLCQYGSQGMAQAGRSYPEILGMYYPGASLTKMY